MFEVFKVCFKVDSINAKCLMTKTLIPTDVSDVAGATEQFHECALYVQYLTLHFSQKHCAMAIYICMPAVDGAKSLNELCP